MSIDTFIEIVYPKLNQPVRTEMQLMSGKDLRLTGYGGGKNKKLIENDAVYKVPVQVPEPEVNHRQKLRLAWLRGGKPAVRTYLLKFLHPSIVEEVISVI